MQWYVGSNGSSNNHISSKSSHSSDTSDNHSKSSNASSGDNDDFDDLLSDKNAAALTFILFSIVLFFILPLFFFSLSFWSLLRVQRPSFFEFSIYRSDASDASSVHPLSLCFFWSKTKERMVLYMIPLNSQYLSSMEIPMQKRTRPQASKMEEDTNHTNGRQHRCQIVISNIYCPQKMGNICHWRRRRWKRRQRKQRRTSRWAIETFQKNQGGKILVQNIVSYILEK